MKAILKILFILSAAFIISYKGNAQVVTQQRDTVKVRTAQTDQEKNGQESAGTNRMQNGTSTEKQASMEVKRIRNGRPDMTRAAGARPPSIVRPSGSGVPKGMGRPGGIRRGGR